MPYAFAHPAAVIPVARLLGRRAVPSALAIGSMIPDAWYFVPGLRRADSHDLFGLLWFCLPAGLLAYAAFHLIFKLPMLALLPQRLAARMCAWASAGLPPVPWSAVLLSLAAGAATHIAWDALTHAGLLAAHRLLQHASTVVGSAILALWLARKLRATQPRSGVQAAAAPLRAAVLAALCILPASAFAMVWLAFGSTVFQASTFRMALRAGGITALSTAGLIALLFCLAWQWMPPRRARRSSAPGGYGEG